MMGSRSVWRTGSLMYQDQARERQSRVWGKTTALMGTNTQPAWWRCCVADHGGNSSVWRILLLKGGRLCVTPPVGNGLLLWKMAAWLEPFTKCPVWNHKTKPHHELCWPEAVEKGGTVWQHISWSKFAKLVCKGHKWSRKGPWSCQLLAGECR